MGSKDRIKKLEQVLGEAGGPPPQVFIDARNRRTRYLRGLLCEGLGEPLDETERAFMASYKDSEAHAEDSQLISRYAPPDQGSPEAAAQRRAKMKETLDAIVERRHRLGI